MKENSAVFIGHSDCSGVSTAATEAAILQLIDCGVTVFYSGGQGGFDRICARRVFELKKRFPEIKNVLVIPYLSFHIYDPSFFDEILYPEGFEKYHYKAAIPARNRYMVQHAAHAVCWIRRSWGGAAKTYAYAIRQQLHIISL